MIDKKTALVTGASSGMGKAIAKRLLVDGYRVYVAARQVEKMEDLVRLGATPLRMDISREGEIKAAVETILAEVGTIDVLVNNAGFGAAAPLETTALDTARALFETNTFGTLAVTQAALPQMRERGAGAIVNVTSSVTLKALPLVGAYRASKAAVNAFTESLAAEVEPFGVRVRLVLPGRSPETRFRDNAGAHMGGLDHPAYGDLVQRVFAQFADDVGPVTQARDVAEAVWRAATDPTAPMRLPAGADAEAWARETA